jgi:hypothetical protein
MSKDEKFPKTLYVKRDVDGDDTYFIANEDTSCHAEVNEVVTIGVYKLRTELELYAWTTTDEYDL